MSGSEDSLKQSDRELSEKLKDLHIKNDGKATENAGVEMNAMNAAARPSYEEKNCLENVQDSTNISALASKVEDNQTEQVWVLLTFF